jgi:hypothetical protein
MDQIISKLRSVCSSDDLVEITKSLKEYEEGKEYETEELEGEKRDLECQLGELEGEKKNKDDQLNQLNYDIYEKHHYDSMSGCGVYYDTDLSACPDWRGNTSDTVIDIYNQLCEKLMESITENKRLRGIISSLEEEDEESEDEE